MKSKLIPIINQFVKFGLVGILNTAISQGITYGIIFLFKYLHANINENILVFGASFIGFLISVLNSYYWNNKYVFQKTTENNWCTLAKSYICYGSTWLTSFAVAFISLNVINISVIIVPVVSMIITIPLNFLMNKFWAFK